MYHIYIYIWKTEYNYGGLKKRATFDELITYIETEPNTIKYPDRTATTMANSFHINYLHSATAYELDNIKERIQNR